jgi:hypothetical protein
MNDQTPLVCRLDAIPAASRPEHIRLARDVVIDRRGDVTELEHGWSIRYSSELFLDLARWMENERRCCPFLTFRVDLTSDSLTVELCGPEGAKELLAPLLGKR